ncbi:hypothetical protein OCK74_21035 [Chitinophagaceae bacterium LB-8]|uniref:Uncharacterized protein n=1 Tax=Paraflavisolibacter caeni TaxID=2982496 RepID=A0A9X3BJT0_9BACT|nr:hypothetical protein [Paraflavisolibacter caeni]MCU7551618.1 hypothetical protein [Paraflavisolibacter caeni]
MTFEAGYEKQEAMPEEINMEQMPLQDKVIHVLSILRKGSPDEVAMEIMERQGIAAEDGVAELTLETAELLETLLEEGVVTKVKDRRQKVRYSLTAPPPPSNY